MTTILGTLLRVSSQRINIGSNTDFGRGRGRWIQPTRARSIDLIREHDVRKTPETKLMFEMHNDSRLTVEKVERANRGLGRNKYTDYKLRLQSTAQWKPEMSKRI